MGNNGFTIPIDREFMLIMGGITARDLSFVGTDGNTYNLYNFCEDYTSLTGLNATGVFLTCGEELLNDIWIYDVLFGTW
jgi:hypothetical protein